MDGPKGKMMYQMLYASIGTTGMNSHLSMVSYLEHSGLLFLTAGEKKCETASMNHIKVLSNANSEHETSYFGLACLLRLKIRSPSVPHAANSREHNPKKHW